jgi:predicted phosphodiesterase
MPYTVERTNEDVITIRHDDVKAGWEQKYLLISDVHFDSPHCDRKMLTKHLEQAKAAQAGVLCIGDWFDAMGGKNDKRSHKSGIRSGDSHDNYFDLLVDHSSDYLQPYSSLLVMLSNGNHETAITKHNETDILQRLCRELNVLHGGYSGFVRMMFQKGQGGRSTKRVHYHHGSGGGGPVTEAKIANARKLVSFDADIYLSGHIHVTDYSENERVTMSDSGRRVDSTQYLITIPGYKNHYRMAGSWEVEKSMKPKPRGGWWMTFYYDGDAPGCIGTRFERAA